MTAPTNKLLSTTVIPAMKGVGGLLAVGAIAVPLGAIAVKTAAAACNPCAAKKPANACNPCNPCNPCAAKKTCNPCAAAAAKASECVVPSVQKAAACNPCAAKKPTNACNPCNPCAVKKPANACNPCAAKSPCAASNPCNPCSPCGAVAVADVELEPAEANAAYDCLKAGMKAAYAGSAVPEAAGYLNWKAFSTAPYASATHGGRHVMNYANDIAEEPYGKYEEVGEMPVGSILAKDSFVVQTNGNAAVGPLFLMEKMGSGFNEVSGDWKYTMIMPNGTVAGVTNGQGSENMVFCYECHMAMEDTDSLFFLPEDLRVK